MDHGNFFLAVQKTVWMKHDSVNEQVQQHVFDNAGGEKLFKLGKLTRWEIDPTRELYIVPEK